MKIFPFWALIFCFVLSQVSAKTEIILGDIPLSQNFNLPNFVPTSLINQSEIIISKNQYVLSYNRERRSPNWVAWKLEPDGLVHTGRVGNFSQDTILENYLSQFSEHAVTPNSYRGSCFDRGHQIPSADRDDTETNNSETFLMSNMVPQTPFLNRVIWSSLEAYTRSLVEYDGKKAFIISGPIYDEDFGKIGPNKDIPIPSKNFKIVYFLEAYQSAEDINETTPQVAVLVPNILSSGKKPFEDILELCSPFKKPNDSRIEWENYQTTVAEIEKLSGFKLTKF